MAIIQNDDIFTLVDVQANYSKLPVGVYNVDYSAKEGYFLVRKEDFKLPNKIYGDHSIVDRWIHSYKHNSDKNLGILLSGLKGTGKTITAQMFCIKMSLPVIIISENYHGSEFINFLTKKDLGECIIFIDEFEKIYNNQRNANCQDDIISMMDGNFQIKRIFLLTLNEFKISEYLVNRPNRIKYRKEYLQLEQSCIEEVIEDMLINKEHKESIFEFFERINISTYDILISLIKEMNLFNEDAISCGKHMNLKAESFIYEISELVNGKEHACGSIKITGETKNATIERQNIEYLYTSEMTQDEKDRIFWSVGLKFEDCEKIAINADSFILKDIETGSRFKFTKQLFHSLIF